MSAANLTPEQQKVLSLIQMFENTGGSAGYLKHLEDIKAGTRNAPQIDESGRAVDEIYVDIEITADQPAKDHFTIKVTTVDQPLGAPVYIGEGFSHAPGSTTISFSGCLCLKAGISWEQITEAGMMPFKTVGVQYSWEVDMAGAPVMWFKMCLKGEEAPRNSNLNQDGMMFWRKALPYPGE
ncbi:hypothetical protein FRC01_000329 [Tulasnella sp. 417]|nr:hypothetical protein FRC01_000329 [Tulasnella sp. 417]